MIQDQAIVNRVWSEVLLEELTRFGVTEVCIAPGSRSTPLTLEAEANSKLNIHTHFDERGLGFLALGLAKASQKPVAIIVTSGTAVANLLPAIAESKLTGEKLVVLTADRPAELVGCGANQAINQLGIFSSHVTDSLNLSSPTMNISLGWLLSSVDNTLFQQETSGGAVHINCPYPEPLYTKQDKSCAEGYLNTVKAWKESQTIYATRIQSKTIAPENSIDFYGQKGIVLIGSLPLEQAQQATRFAQQLGWPVLCDVQSGVTSDWSHYDVWLQNVRLQSQLIECDCVVQFGARFVSKRLNQWLKNHVVSRQCTYVYISDSDQRDNQNHLSQQHIVTDIAEWVEAHLSPTKLSKHAGWADELKAYSQQVDMLLSQFSAQSDSLSELALACLIEQHTQYADVFLGNSLFVRLVDMFGRIDESAIYTNRGASGIDGIVATAAGVYRAQTRPLILFIGDTSLLYDLNSLALLTHCQIPIVVAVTNNDGGAIFDLLPVPEQQRETLYQMPHGYDFQYAAKQFGLKYQNVASQENFNTVVSEHLTTGQGALIVEVQTPANQASTQLKQFMNRVHAL
ncbi:2-succinyl-5-enolpyruvyl-6-hydroxy-3-cyclohexene-1-carboxylic-acid synthase [Vibrio paucivorans]